MRGIYVCKKDVLMHSKERPNHKYIVRIKTTNGYRYFYDEKEYQSFLNKNGSIVEGAEYTKYNSDGSVKETGRADINRLTNSMSYKKEEYSVNSKGNAEKKVTEGVRMLDGTKMDSHIVTTYEHKGKNIIEKLLFGDSYWDKKKTNSSVSTIKRK